MNIYNDTTNSLKPQNSKTQKTKLENQVENTKLEHQVGKGTFRASTLISNIGFYRFITFNYYNYCFYKY